MAADTSPEAQAVQREVWRLMGPGERVRLAAEMSEEARKITLAGIANSHPDLTPTERMNELVRRMYGVDLAPRSRR